ncbi:MAG: class I SAM-dependent methyltransferase [Selenomonadaceae bacterium]|nr:class I SAM-dependent methyltransferase [Selenomonadaceae bacterium]
MVAGEYDSNRRKFVPCFDDFYIGTTKFIAENISSPQKILDLGAGTGLLTKFWLEYFPNAEYILIDIAADMLKVAAQRFSNAKNIFCRVMDYLKDFPAETFDAVISALSIHHLADGDKLELFEKIYSALPEGGIFVNYDQFCAETLTAESWYKKYWQSQLIESGLTAHDLELFAERVKLDKECSVTAECKILRRAGFKIIQCVYTCQKFSVIVAVKEGDYQIDN